MPEDTETLVLIRLWSEVIDRAWEDWDKLHRYKRQAAKLSPSQAKKRRDILRLTNGHPRDWLYGQECRYICNNLLGGLVDHAALRQAVTDRAIRWQERLRAA